MRRLGVVRVRRRRPLSRSCCSRSGSGSGGGARRCGAEEGVLEDAHVRGDRGISPGGSGSGHVLRLGLRRRRTVEDGVVVVRVVGDGVVVGVHGRGPRDGGCDGGRADPLEAHGGRLGLRLRWRRRRAVGELVVVLRRRRGRCAGGELLDDVAELVLADVVDLRLGLGRAVGGGLLLRLRRRRRGLADGAAELVDAEVRVLAGGCGGATAAAVAGGAIHGDGRIGV